MQRRKRVLIVLVCCTLIPTAGLSLMSWFSKRPDTLGATDGRLADCPASPNCVCTHASDPDHRMDAIGFDGDPAELSQRLADVLGSMPRARIVTRDDLYIHAEFTSAVFRFVDDVELLIDRENQVIHFRSASRVGHSDLGVNRKRMERLRELVMEPE